MSNTDTQKYLQGYEPAPESDSSPQATTWNIMITIDNILPDKVEEMTKLLKSMNIYKYEDWKNRLKIPVTISSTDTKN